jgi:hypothetical protein
MAIFPNDDTEKILKKMYGRGDDLTKARDITFFMTIFDQNMVDILKDLITDNLKNSEVFIRKVSGNSFDIRVNFFSSPNYNFVSSTAATLENVAKTMGGRFDGWECESFYSS